jgi:hypothetical protein
VSCFSASRHPFVSVFQASKFKELATRTRAIPINLVNQESGPMETASTSTSTSTTTTQEVTFHASDDKSRKQPPSKLPTQYHIVPTIVASKQPDCCGSFLCTLLCVFSRFFCVFLVLLRNTDDLT